MSNDKTSIFFESQIVPVDDPSTDEAIKTIEKLFVDHVQYGHFMDGQTPARRAAFITMHGGAYGTFTINKNLPKSLQHGVFQPGKTYNVWVRYSSDVPYSKSEKLSTIGIGIKLFDVPGKNILDNESWPSRSDPDALATNVDFTLQNYPVFFAKNAQQMSEFKTAAVNGADALNAFLDANPDVNTILNAMEQDVSSVLESTLWSCIPFKLGVNTGQYCKYILSATDLPPKSGIGEDDPFYMKLDLQKRLKSGSATFSFKIHQRTSLAQSIDNAQDDWTAPDGSEDLTNMIDAATLYLPQQDISVRGQEEYSEALSYNPWRTLPEHTPVGTIAEARKVVYLASSKMRRNLNGQSIGEPVIPRPSSLYPAGDPKSTPAWPPSSANPVNPQSDSSEIVRVAIHPGIGVARVGNSLEAGNDFYIGPEVDTPPQMEKFGTRDSAGAIKRQAARFRLYGYNSSGEVVREITAADATIKWSVHLANKKAQWFKFDRAFDVGANSKLDLMWWTAS